MKGALITISGSDGAGKTTQVPLLAKLVMEMGYPVQTMKFPRYETETGKRVKAYLEGRFGEKNNLSAYFVAGLYAADRHAAKDEILSIINSGTNLILDRYVADNLAHQGARYTGEERLNLIKWILNLEYKELGLPRTDLILCMHLPRKFSKKAIDARNNIKDIHEADDDYLKAVEETFLTLGSFEQNFNIINCISGEERLTIEEVTAKLWEVVQPKLTK